MRIGPKLSLAFIVMLAFAGVIGLVSIVQLSKVARDADVIETDVLGSVSKLAAIRFNLSVSRSTALETLIHFEINPPGSAFYPSLSPSSQIIPNLAPFSASS